MGPAYHACHEPRICQGPPGEARLPPLPRVKPVGRGGPVGGARLEDVRREVGVVDRIGEMLRLQAKRPVLAVRDALLPGDRAVEEVAGVELNPRLTNGKSGKW